MARTAPISVKITEEDARRLDHLATATGRSRTFYINEAIRTHLDDLEDTYLAEATLQEMRREGRSTMSLEEFLDGIDV